MANEALESSRLGGRPSPRDCAPW